MKNEKYPYESIDNLGLKCVEWEKMEWKRVKVQFITIQHSEYSATLIVQFKIRQEHIDKMMETGVIEMIIRGANVKTDKEIYRISKEMIITSTARKTVQWPSGETVRDARCAMTFFCVYPYDFDKKKDMIKFKIVQNEKGLFWAMD